MNINNPRKKILINEIRAIDKIDNHNNSNNNIFDFIYLIKFQKEESFISDPDNLLLFIKKYYYIYKFK